MRPSKKKYLIAIVEPERKTAALLKNILSSERRYIAVYESAGRFIESLKFRIPQALITDTELPDIGGKDLVMVMRNNPKTAKIVIIAVSSKKQSGPLEAAEGLDSGADEYFSIPFDRDVFSLRFDSLAGRQARMNASDDRSEDECRRWVLDNLEIDIHSRTVFVDGKEIKLTALEFDILVFFARNKNRVVTRKHLIDAVWINRMNANLRAVDKRIEILRAKLGRFGSRIETVFGIGYVFR
ncbi:MAG: response regulator transcription factor [Elusimicrobia bacterium]|nr:response regulator transcription factor [Elusimicrobiota bacterium]